MLHKQSKSSLLTGSLGPPLDGNVVRASQPSDRVERHVHVSDKVDQELERIGRSGVLQVATLLDPPTKDIRIVSYGTEDVYVFYAFPSLRSGEEAQFRRIIVDGVDVMHRGRPRFFTFDRISPRGDGGEGARRSWILGVEDRTEVW